MPKIIQKSLIFIIVAAFITVSLLFNLLNTSCSSHRIIVTSCCCDKQIQQTICHTCKCFKDHNSAFFPKEVAILPLFAKFQDIKSWARLSIYLIRIYSNQKITNSNIDFVDNITLKRLKTVIIQS